MSGRIFESELATLWRSGVHRIQAECRTERIGGGFVSLLLVDRVMSLWLKDGV